MDSVVFPVLLLIVLSAVQLYRQLYNRTVEVQNIGANTILPKKFHSVELPVTHMSPKNFFSVGLLAA